MTTRRIHFRVTVEIDEDAARVHEDDDSDWQVKTTAVLATAMQTICLDNLPSADLDPLVRVRMTGVSVDYDDTPLLRRVTDAD